MSRDHIFTAYQKFYRRKTTEVYYTKFKQKTLKTDVTDSLRTRLLLKIKSKNSKHFKDFDQKLLRNFLNFKDFDSDFLKT